MLDEKNKIEFVDEEVAPKEDIEVLDNANLEKLPDDAFELVDNKDYAHDQKFETKPTTFLKDSIKRFAKNKSSVVAAWILGILLLMAFVVPIVDRNDVSVPHSNQVYLEPKLFDSGFGFWDGCKTYSYIAYEDREADPEKGIEEYHGPNSADFNIFAVSDLKVDADFSYTNSYSSLGKGGYINLSKYVENITSVIYYKSTPYSLNIDLSSSLDFSITLFDEEIEYYQRVPYSISFIYHDKIDAETSIEHEVFLVENSTNYSGTFDYDVKTKILEENATPVTVKDGCFKVSINTVGAELNSNILIEKIDISTDSTDEDYKTAITAPSFKDANENVGRQKNIVVDKKTISNPAYWSCNGNKYIYKAKIRFCSFTYDTYKAAFGKQIMDIEATTVAKYKNKYHWCDYETSDPVGTFTITNAKKCPVVRIVKVIPADGVVPTTMYRCEAIYYKVKGMSSMPKYLMGTDQAGRDMFKYVFDGLKTSLLLGVITSAVCFAFGLCWGAISGYFGGTVDLAMERFTDILNGMPWIVVMTLCIVHLGQNFVTFAIALCLTGWIGTASTTRTQFYRFKGREYILASRTLGASDMRLIFRHILPNAMGTIITGAVMMIPSVIFSEATISYLGLGLRGMSSLGVILSKNQNELLQHPYLLLFPSVVIALLMISFNLFGNGLRDAINPSLKGEGE